MVKQNKAKVYFTEKYTDYLIEWSMKPDEVLATELNSLFNQKFTTEDIAEKRAEMKLPPPDREKSLNAAILGRGQQSPSKVKSYDKPFSAAQMIRGSKPKPKPPEVRSNFQVVSAEVQDKIDQLNKDKRENSDFTFDPVFVTKPVKGKIYVYPGIGPVVCGDTTKENIAGFDMQKISFSAVFTNGAKGSMAFDPARIAQKFIRELATPEMMEDVLHKLAHGNGVLKNLPKVGAKHKVFYEGIIASPNLAELVNLLCHSFKSGKALSARGTLEIEFGNASLALIAAEYAVVKQVPLDHAKDLLERVVGKPTLDDLSRYNYGRGGSKATPTSP